MKKIKKVKATNIIAYILFATLILSVGYAIVRCVMAPSEIAEGEPYEKLKSDYLLMIVQCVLGIVVMMLPTFITHKWKIVVPNAIVIPNPAAFTAVGKDTMPSIARADKFP